MQQGIVGITDVKFQQFRVCAKLYEAVRQFIRIPGDDDRRVRRRNHQVRNYREGDIWFTVGGELEDVTLNGTIVAHLVEKNQPVAKGQPILVMEAMKMEHSITAPYDGSVEEFFFQPGELVDGGSTLLAFSSKEADEG